MPLYTGLDGAMIELNRIYASVDGAAKNIKNLYGGVGGTAKEIFTSGYRWKKYSLVSVPAIKLDPNITTAIWYEADGQTRQLWYVDSKEDVGKVRWYSSNPNNRTNITYTEGVSHYVTDSALLANPSAYTGKYFCSNYGWDSTTSSWVDGKTSVVLYGSGTTYIGSGFFKFNGTLSNYNVSSGHIADLKGEAYSIVEGFAKGDYVETFYSENMNDYPLNGIKDGYWYVFDGDLTWRKYELGSTYEPSSYGISATFYSSSTSYPVLMASQAKKDDLGNVDWGTTYSAASWTNIRNNYSKYPFSSFTSTLNADSLYKITSASTSNGKRQQVSGWKSTGQGAGTYIGNVIGKLGDYPDNGVQDGYWYILNV